MFASAPPAVNLKWPARSTIARLLGAAGAALAPPCCVLCDRPGLPGPIDLCAACLAELPRAPPDAPLRDAPLRDAPSYADIFERVCCPWRFEFPVDALVRALKFHGERAHARLLGTLLALDRARCAAPLPDLVVPVPLHPLRLRERGYNQAAELARFAARSLALPFDRALLCRARPTRGQTGLSARERTLNVSGAFTATRTLRGAPRLALVDDVVTTGSTACAAGAVLRAAGAGAIELWAVCHAARRRGRDCRENSLQYLHRAGRATGHDDIHRDHIGHPAAARIVLAEDSAGAAAIAERDDELRVRHRLEGAP